MLVYLKEGNRLIQINQPFDMLAYNLLGIIVNQEQSSNYGIQTEIVNLFNKLGLSPQLNGYIYLKFAVLSTFSTQNGLNDLDSKVYSHIAKKHDTTSQNVERSIRHALNKMWTQKNGYVSKFFKTRPTPLEFIAKSVELLVSGFVKDGILL